jgi:hypothetical protein
MPRKTERRIETSFVPACGLSIEASPQFDLRRAVTRRERATHTRPTSAAERLLQFICGDGQPWPNAHASRCGSVENSIAPSAPFYREHPSRTPVGTQESACAPRTRLFHRLPCLGPLGRRGRGGFLGLFCLGYGAICFLRNRFLLRLDRAVAADAAALCLGNGAVAPHQQR